MGTLTGTPVHTSSRSGSDLETIDRPLCVDLDGTLIRTDLLLEQLLILLKQSPGAVFLVAWWFFRGRSVLKREVASRVKVPVEMLPYRDEVLEFVCSEHRRGRQVLLVTAADQAVAESVAAYIGEFDAVYGSNGSVNLKGQVKAGFLTGLLGTGNFDYIGDSYSDLPVWKAAGSAHVVGSQETAKRVARDTAVVQVFETHSPSFIAWLHSIRLLHWSKNLLVLLPVLLAHKFAWHAWRDSLLGFVLFGACASGLYILNDLLDLHSDRRHPSKSKRPFAAGEFPLWVGVLESTLLVGISLACALLINLKFAGVLIGYAVLTVTYSWKLKKIPLVDVFVLSSFYTLRIWAGASISSNPVSEWFSAFCLFFFLSLAMAKRHSELQRAREVVEGGNSGRGYVVKDRELLAMFGVASSFAAVVILCLYVRGTEVSSLYRDPSQLLWLCPIVLYWLARVWLLAGRGELDLDPVLFAVRDRVSWILAAIAIVDLAIGGVRTK
jgi:4-hydroxybenzoate polyprenyltransferase/phosphoserine phosphatase